MAVAYVGYITGTDSAGSTTAAINLSAASVGDLAITTISRRDGTSDPTGVPSGWTLVTSLIVSTSRSWVYYKVLASGDLTTHTWTWAASQKTMSTCVRYNGTHTTTPVEDYATYTDSVGVTPHYYGSLTNDQPMLVGIATTPYTLATSQTVGTGYTERLDTGSTTPDFWHEYADTNGTWGGGTSNVTVTPSRTTTALNFHLAIAPAAESSGVPRHSDYYHRRRSA